MAFIEILLKKNYKTMTFYHEISKIECLVIASPPIKSQLILQKNHIVFYKCLLLTNCIVKQAPLSIVVNPACCQIETNAAHPSQESCRINNNLTKTQQEHLAGRPVNLFCCASFCDGIPRSEREGVRE